MGNKASRRRADTSVSSSKATGTAGVPAVPAVQLSAADPSDDNKGVSCPDLSAGAVPYREDTAESKSGRRHVNYTIYRSYSNVAEATRRSEPRPDIRVYRRNTAARYAAGRRADPAERSQTLPRGFGRSRSAMSGLQSTGAPPVNDSDSSTLPPSRYTSAGELKRQTALGLSASGGLGPVDTRPAKRTISIVSMTSIGYRATADDLPDTGTIKRRLAQFETVFTRALTKLYTSLADSVQLSSLSIAVRPNRANQHVSLWHYLNSPDVPLDMLADDGRGSGDGRPAFMLTIQPALFGGLMHVRRDRHDDPAAPISLAGEVVACLAAEAGAELARIFEYQIALLSDGLAIELLAGHAAHCVVNYMTTSGRHLDRNTIVLGAIRGEHLLESTIIAPKLSVIVGQKELKWELDEILKRPGLRKELFLFSGDIEVDELNPPWRFFTSYHHDPMLYGYRGLIVEWDYTSVADFAGSSDVATTAYRLNGEDEASFPDEVDVRPDDFHRHYCPYRRLVGAGVVERFNRDSTSEKTNVEMRASSSLAEFVRRLQGSSYARDHIQPVYRPVTVLPATDYAVDDYNDQRTGSRDDWYAMVDRDRSVINHAQEPSVMSEYLMTTKVGVIVTPSTAISNLLPVVPEVSVEDKPNANGTEVSREPVSPCPVMNGGRHVNGNGKIDHHVREPEVADDVDVVRVKKPAETSTTTVVTRTTVVRQVNGDAVNVADDHDVGDVPVNGSDHRVMCTTELADDSADAVKTSTFGYVIDETNRRTIRSDL